MNITRSEPFQPQLTVNALVKGTSSDLELQYLAGQQGGDRTIDQPRVQKPGLVLAGYMEYLHRGRVQILGNSEITFLKRLPAHQRREVVKNLLGYGVCCFIITKGLNPPPEMLAEADRFGIPLLRTRLISSVAIYTLGRFLEEELAPSLQLHGVLLDVYGLGVLLLGKSGIGKSECALDLIVRGHRIISDDSVTVRRRGSSLTGSSPEMTRFHMEVRGIGIINVKDLFGVASVRFVKDVELVIHLDRWDQKKAHDRLGLDDRTYEILGIELPLLQVPVAPGRHLSVLVEVAARNHLLKRKGYDPARTLAGELDARIQQAKTGPEGSGNGDPAPMEEE